MPTLNMILSERHHRVKATWSWMFTKSTISVITEAFRSSTPTLGANYCGVLSSVSVVL